MDDSPNEFKKFAGVRLNDAYHEARLSVSEKKRLHDLLPLLTSRDPYSTTSEVLVCLFINGDLCIIQDPEYLSKCLVMPLINLFHNTKSSRFAIFHLIERRKEVSKINQRITRFEDANPR